RVGRRADRRSTNSHVDRTGGGVGVYVENRVGRSIAAGAEEIPAAAPHRKCERGGYRRSIAGQRDLRHDLAVADDLEVINRNHRAEAHSSEQLPAPGWKAQLVSQF